MKKLLTENKVHLLPDSYWKNHYIESVTKTGLYVIRRGKKP